MVPVDESQQALQHHRWYLQQAMPILQALTLLILFQSCYLLQIYMS